ncbi:MAG TPA: hypothetical protein H9866_01895 [Candidatus Tidjanibacter gallistercoris]|nr:hypothetical protein [Candidatus Tidjanibacter gallistercoris]
MKRIIPLLLLPMLLVSCDKAGEWFGGGGESGATPPEIRVETVTDVKVTIGVGSYEETEGVEFGICWAEHPAPGTEQTIALSGPGMAVEIDGLAPQTEYYARSYARGGNGKTTFGDEVQFTTDRERPKVKVMGCNVFDQAVEVTCMAWGPRIESVGVCWNTEGAPSTENGESEDCVYDAENDVYTVTLTGLEESTQYYLKGYVRTDDGATYLSEEELDFRTEGVYVPDMWVNMPIEREDTYADITYEVNEEHIIRRGLCWAAEPEPTVDDAKTDDGTQSGVLTVRIEGLEPATDYYIRPYVVLPHAVDGERLYYGTEEVFTTYEADVFFEVPDAVFAAYLVEAFDKNGDGRVSEREAADVSYMDDLGYRNIASLEGIEHFPNLAVIRCPGNRITKLDLSGNPKLFNVDCSDNNLTELILGTSALEMLDCAGNVLTDLDISGLPALRDLDCSDNMLRTLDCSANVGLEELSCRDNPLTSLLGLGSSPELNKLYCGSCSLTELDLSANTKLTYLFCDDNELTELDLSHCTALTNLSCRFNSLSVLDVAGATQLRDIDCGYNEQIAVLDLSRCKKLERVDCSKNRIAELDLSDNPFLGSVRCEQNELTLLDVSGCSVLESLMCYGNALSSLDLGGLSVLDFLNCSENRLVSLDTGDAVRLTTLVCNTNSLGSLDVSRNTYLEYLDCGKNDITTLDLRNCPDLEPGNLVCDSYVNVVWK